MTDPYEQAARELALVLRGISCAWDAALRMFDGDLIRSDAERIALALRRAADEEREACAQAADDRETPFEGSDFFEGMRQGRRAAARDIRARSTASKGKGEGGNNG
jgi:hypothetical protein